MQCFDTFGFSYPEGEMRMCFGVLLGESGSTRQQISRCQKFVVCWKFGEQHLHCHHGMWVTQCQVTMSAAGSLSLSSSVFLSHWKGGFTPNLWRQRVHRIFRSSSHCQDLDTSESTLFRKKKDVHKVDSKINDKSVVETSPLLHQHVAMHRKWSFFDWKATRRRSLQGSGCWFYLCSPKVNSKNCFFVMTILELSFPIVQEQTSLNKFDCLWDSRENPHLNLWNWSLKLDFMVLFPLYHLKNTWI